MPATRIHHVNIVVKDLDEAIARFRRALATGPFTTVDHAPRGARVAYTTIGESRLVLVCPYAADTLPARHLAEHGEGVFLLSVGIDDFDAHLEQVFEATDPNVRHGILDWRVADIGECHGVLLQLTDDSREE